MQCVAGHVVAVAAGQERDRAGDVIGGFGPPEGYPRDASAPGLATLPTFDLRPLLVQLLPHGRVDDTGADAIRSDALRSKGLRRGAGNADHTGLARGVVPGIWQTTAIA